VAPNKNELKGFYQQLQSDFQALLQANPKPKALQINATTKAAQYWQERHELQKESKQSFEALQELFGTKRIVSNASNARWKQWLVHRAYQKQIPTALFEILPQLGKVWSEKEALWLEKAWEEWQLLRAALKNDFALETTSDLDELAKKSLICQQFQSQVFQ
jgi:hypothetical protein